MSADPHDAAALLLLEALAEGIRNGQVVIRGMTARDDPDGGRLELSYEFNNDEPGPAAPAEVPLPVVEHFDARKGCPGCGGRLTEHSDGWTCIECGADVLRDSSDS